METFVTIYEIFVTCSEMGRLAIITHAQEDVSSFSANVDPKYTGLLTCGETGPSQLMLLS